MRQGSNLGPFLFLVYINDIFDTKIKRFVIHFADDAVSIEFGDNIDSLNENVQNDMNIISDWLLENELALNAIKTKYMLIKEG